MQIIPEEVITQKIKMTLEERMAFWRFIQSGDSYTRESDIWIFNELYHKDTFDMRKEGNVVWFKHSGGAEGRNLDKFKKFCIKTGFSLERNKRYDFSQTKNFC